MDGDGRSVELAGGDEALGGGEEMGVFDDKGGKDMGMLDNKGKEIGVFDDDEGVEEAGAFDDRGGEEAGVFDDGEGEELGVFDERRGKEMGMLEGKRGEVGVSDDDVNEVGVWGWEDGTEVDGTSVGAEEAGGLPEDDVDGTGKMHWPRRSTPRGHVTLGEEEVDRDEAGWDD
jgi:hypothetical protein